jgi:hypothetical protein
MDVSVMNRSVLSSCTPAFCTSIFAIAHSFSVDSVVSPVSSLNRLLISYIPNGNASQAFL